MTDNLSIAVHAFASCVLMSFSVDETTVNLSTSFCERRTYIQKLCEDLPEVMNHTEEWRERVRDICAGGTTRWWWSLWFLIILVWIYQPLHCKEDMTQGQFWSRVPLNWIQNFPSSRLVTQLRLKNPIHPTIYSLLKGFMSFPRTLLWSKKQAVSSKIWTWVAVSISSENNHYSMCIMVILVYREMQAR